MFKTPNNINRCFCIGPQNGEPYCPCMMKDLVQIEGAWYTRASTKKPLSISEPNEALPPSDLFYEVK